jgi:hypothetical protein
VPYWWDRKISSLQATIHRARPDIRLPYDNGIPIPRQKPLPQIQQPQQQPFADYFRQDTELWEIH